MNIVFDTNVLLSAAFFEGQCKRLLAHCLARPRITIFLSQYILDEFIKHGSGKLNAPDENVQAFTTVLKQHCTTVEPAHVPSNVFSDPDDLAILGTAIAAQAEFLITGDKALLTLVSYKNVKIIAPGTFYEQWCA